MATQKAVISQKQRKSSNTGLDAIFGEYFAETPSEISFSDVHYDAKNGQSFVFAKIAEISEDGNSVGIKYFKLAEGSVDKKGVRIIYVKNAPDLNWNAPQKHTLGYGDYSNLKSDRPTVSNFSPKIKNILIRGFKKKYEEVSQNNVEEIHSHSQTSSTNSSSSTTPTTTPPVTPARRDSTPVPMMVSPQVSVSVEEPTDANVIKKINELIQEPGNSTGIEDMKKLKTDATLQDYRKCAKERNPSGCFGFLQQMWSRSNVIGDGRSNWVQELYNLLSDDTKTNEGLMSGLVAITDHKKYEKISRAEACISKYTAVSFISNSH